MRIGVARAKKPWKPWAIEANPASCLDPRIVTLRFYASGNLLLDSKLLLYSGCVRCVVEFVVVLSSSLSCCCVRCVVDVARLVSLLRWSFSFAVLYVD
jgi:hypothetical protein